MSSLRTFWMRLKNGSIKRMIHNVNLVHKESGKSRLLLYPDVLYWMLGKGYGYLEYYTYGFAYIGKEKRLTFMNMNEHLAMTRKLNNRDYYDVFDDKCQFYRTFRDFLKRDYVDLHDGPEAFEAFCQKHPVFFVKQPVSYGGMGVKKIKLSPEEDLKALFMSLTENGFYLAEEVIVQDEKMASLNPASVNTIRIVTIVSDTGKVHVVYALLRVGSGKNDVDNVSSGGMYTLLSEEGETRYPFFCDKDVAYYEKHPVTGQDLLHFHVPQYEEAVKMCEEAARVVPQMRYIGWDIAITKNGPVMVEGNNLPGYDMCQNHRFHEDGCGLKERFRQIIED